MNQLEAIATIHSVKMSPLLKEFFYPFNLNKQTILSEKGSNFFC